MSNWIISLMFAAGGSTWVYTKFQRYSGNNTKQSLIASAVIGVILLFGAYSALGLFIK